MANVNHVYMLQKSLGSFLFAVFVFISHRRLSCMLVGWALLIWLWRVGFLNIRKALQTLHQADQLDL